MRSDYQSRKRALPVKPMVLTCSGKKNTVQAMAKKITTSEAARMLSARGASKGGKARAKALSPERRKEIAKNAIRARWQKGKIKFLVIPGRIESKNDREMHRITAPELMRLYRVNPAECLVIDERDMYEHPPEIGLSVKGYSHDYLNSLIRLTPDYYGNYRQFWL